MNDEEFIVQQGQRHGPDLVRALIREAAFAGPRAAVPDGWEECSEDDPEGVPAEVVEQLLAES